MGSGFRYDSIMRESEKLKRLEMEKKEEIRRIPYSEYRMLQRHSKLLMRLKSRIQEMREMTAKVGE